jgi:hypothetical protein
MESFSKIVHRFIFLYCSLIEYNEIFAQYRAVFPLSNIRAGVQLIIVIFERRWIARDHRLPFPAANFCEKFDFFVQE